MDDDSGMPKQGRHMAEQQEQAGVHRTGGIADAIHSAADGLKDHMPRAASYVHEAAGRLEDAAGGLESRSLEDLFNGVTGFARNQPLAFFGGAILAGFAFSRFLRSSADGERI
jgi:hypothetical protein